MAEQFYTILTTIGKAKIANAAALGEEVELTEMALGDGGGSYYNPTEDQTELRNEVWRGAIGTVTIDEENPTWITIQTVVPSQHGGFMIREAGVFDNEGDLIAVGKYPETYKPVAADGSIKDLVIRMILEVSNTASVVLKVDPTVVLATQRQVNEAEARAKAYTDQEVGEVDQALTVHLAEITTEEGRHGLRYWNNKLEFFDGSDWIEIKTGGDVPIGSVIPWTTTTIPDGWLECNGQAVSRTDFSELFAKIGTTFGSGDGSTTFNVPDLRGEFIRGWDNGRGIDSGRAFGSRQADMFKAHEHDIPTSTNNPGTRATVSDDEGRQCESNEFLESGRYYTYSAGGTETRPRNVALMYIIKAKDVAGSDPTVQGANADTLDGFHASAFALSDHGHPEYALADHITHTGEQRSLQQNGYYKMANGLIIQWGKVPCDGIQVVTFPIAFPNICLCITGAKNSQTQDWDPSNYLSFNYITKTGLRLNTREPSSSNNVYWLAIGY